MKDALTILQDYVVNVVANDYESYDLIRSEVLAWASKDHTPATPAAVLDALSTAIGDGLVDCYRYSKGSGKYERAIFDRTGIDEFWFHVSPEGRKYLSRG